jgi:DNA invertase Pin-like site-specific DNA recombinase
MRDVITTVYELADHGITIVPLKSQTGPINTAMGRLLWAIQAWYAEMENEERSENVKAGQARAKAQGKEIGRPREIDVAMAERIRELWAFEGHGYKTIGLPECRLRMCCKCESELRV